MVWIKLVRSLTRNKHVAALGGMSVVLLRRQLLATCVLDGKMLHESDENEKELHARQRLAHASAFAD